MPGSESAIMIFRLPEWRNGRRGGLKNRCRKTCEFKSRLGHQLRIKLPSGSFFIAEAFLQTDFAWIDESAKGKPRKRTEPPGKRDTFHSREQAHHDTQTKRGTEREGAILCEDAETHAQHHPCQ